MLLFIKFLENRCRLTWTKWSSTMLTWLMSCLASLVTTYKLN